MKQRSALTQAVATLVIVALQALTIPASAAQPPATLSGSILKASDQAPLTGARLHAGDPKTGQVYTSQPASADGSFRLHDLPPATYELAVEADAGLYVVQTPVRLAPGQSRTVSVAVGGAQMADDPKAAQARNKPAQTSVWNNPATAALIVLGAAIVLGVVIDEATDDDDEPPASP